MPPILLLLLLSTLLLLCEGEHDLYGGRQGHQGSTAQKAQKQREYYQHTDWSEGSNKSEASQVRMVKQDQGRTQKARIGSCFSCTTLSEQDQGDPDNICFNISRYDEWNLNNKGNDSFVSHCGEEQRFCQVRRVEYKVDNMDEYAQWSLTRSCQETCNPFCVTMGGRTKVTYCTSCCRWDGSWLDPVTKRLQPGERSDNCNVGNSGDRREGLGPVLLLGLVLLHLIRKL